MGILSSRIKKEVQKDRYPLLSREEILHLKEFHSSLYYKESEPGVTRDQLEMLWKKEYDQYFISFVLEFLFASGAETVTADNLIKFFTDFTRGTVDEKVEVLRKVMAPDDPEPLFTANDIYQLVLSVVRSYINCENEKASLQASSWRKKRCPVTENSTLLLAEALCYEVITDEATVSLDHLEHWITTWPRRFSLFLSTVVAHMFDFDADTFMGHVDISQSLMPMCHIYGKHRIFPSVLDVPSVIYLNLALPRHFRDRWQLLFTTVLHGVSWRKFTQLITNKGPTLLIVKDNGNNVFGGFAPIDWEYSDEFRGDWNCFLFTLQPRMRVYESSGRNQRFLLFNRTGVGIGGSPEYHGLFISRDMTHGHSSARCPTFREYESLSHDKEFTVRRMEVWGVGATPVSTRKQSIFTELRPALSAICDPDNIFGGTGASNLQTGDLLKIVGKRKYSDGLGVKNLTSIEDEEDEKDE